jgi:hypothetical protein
VNTTNTSRTLWLRRGEGPYCSPDSWPDVQKYNPSVITNSNYLKAADILWLSITGGRKLLITYSSGLIKMTLTVVSNCYK